MEPQVCVTWQYIRVAKAVWSLGSVLTLGGIIVANGGNGVADNLLVVDRGLGGDLTEDHDHASLGGSLASDLAAITYGCQLC
jgi:hypothetical protein